EMGEPGIEELQRQTVGLLNFTDVPREIFGRQVAFNLLTSPGVDASRAEGFDRRVKVETARLIGIDPSQVELASAFIPVFHGHTIHLTIEFQADAPAAAVRTALQQTRGIRLVDAPEEFSPVDLAGEEAVAVTGLSPDESAPRRLGLWSFCDNLRG